MTTPQQEALLPLIREILDWGRSYGARLNLSDVTVQDTCEAYADKACTILAQLQAAPQATANSEEATIPDYQVALASVDALVRRMDVALNGETSAAKQASLCDLVAQVEALGKQPAQGVGEVVAWLMRHHGSGQIDLARPNQKAIHKHIWSDAFPVYAHPAPSPEAVPDGWTLVPVEPTLEMMEAMPGMPAIGAIGDMDLKNKGWSLKAIQNRHRWLGALTAFSTQQAQSKGGSHA